MFTSGLRAGQAAQASDDRKLYDEVAAYTLSHRDPTFIHQYVVDAYAAQHPEDRKPIGVAFALIGLYLAVEKGFSGKQVQQTHMRFAKHKRPWPTFAPPQHRGDITVADVAAAHQGNARDQMIRKWCASVWDAWHGHRQEVIELIEREWGSGA